MRAEKKPQSERGLLFGIYLLFAGDSDRPVHADFCREPDVGMDGALLEQYRNNRLIRPRAEYMGNPDGQKWVPIGER